MGTNMFKYSKFNIEPDMYKEEKDLKLEKTYELCVSELGLQQAKRDQIIAFYIAIISFVIPTIIVEDLNKYARATGFFTLFVLGIMLAQVVVRYRIYKEIYWLTCRTITRLYTFKHDKICKELVQHIFYNTMEKNASSVIIIKQGKKQTISHWKSYHKILNSAETILYEVLVLMSSLVLWIGIYILVDFSKYGLVYATILAALNFIYWNIYYYRRLTKVYKVIVDGEDKSFNDTYSKAWFLHSF